MGRKCQVCSHPRRLQIDKEIVQGKSIAEISRKYGVSYDSLWSHAKNHLHYQLITAVKKKLETNSFNLMDETEEIIRKAKTIFDRNFAKNTRAGDETALRALSEHRQTLSLLSEAVATYHQIKAMEIEDNMQMYRYQAEKDFEKVLQKFTDDEVAVLEMLSFKACGKFKGDVLKALGLKVPPGGLVQNVPILEEHAYDRVYYDDEDEDNDIY